MDKDSERMAVGNSKKFISGVIVVFLSKKEIAERLGLYTVDGKPNTQVVIHIMADLEIDPCGWRGKVHVYDSSVLPKMREWFWYNFLGNLPDEIIIRKRWCGIVYTPAEEDIKKSA